MAVYAVPGVKENRATGRATFYGTLGSLRASGTCGGTGNALKSGTLGTLGAISSPFFSATVTELRVLLRRLRALEYFELLL